MLFVYKFFLSLAKLCCTTGSYGGYLTLFQDAPSHSEDATILLIGLLNPHP